MIIVDAVARMNCEPALDADERWIFVDRDAAVVEEDVVVGAQAESVVQCIGSVMGCSERPYVGGLRVRTGEAFQPYPAYLASIVVQFLNSSCLFRISHNA